MPLPARIALVLVLLLLSFADADAQRASLGSDRYADLGFRTGSAFPDIVLPEISTNKPTSLADFRGKKLLVLHFASW